MLNDLGRSLWPEAQALLEQAQLLECATQAAMPVAPVQLRLAASTTIANHVLPAILAGFMGRYEQVRFDVVIGNTREVAQAVVDARVDMGFIEANRKLTEIAPLVPERFKEVGHQGWTAMPVTGSPQWYTLVTSLILGVGIGCLAQPQLVVRFMMVESTSN